MTFESNLCNMKAKLEECGVFSQDPSNTRLGKL